MLDLNKLTCKVKPLTIDGQSTFIKVMDGHSRELLEAEIRAEKKKYNLRGLLAALTLCDEHGKLEFSLQDVPKLGALPYTLLDEIVLASADVNEITKEDIEEEKKT